MFWKEEKEIFNLGSGHFPVLKSSRRKAGGKRLELSYFRCCQASLLITFSSISRVTKVQMKCFQRHWKANLKIYSFHVEVEAWMNHTVASCTEPRSDWVTCCLGIKWAPGTSYTAPCRVRQKTRFGLALAQWGAKLREMGSFMTYKTKRSTPREEGIMEAPKHH